MQNFEERGLGAQKRFVFAGYATSVRQVTVLVRPEHAQGRPGVAAWARLGAPRRVFFV